MILSSEVSYADPVKSIANSSTGAQISVQSEVILFRKTTADAL